MAAACEPPVVEGRPTDACMDLEDLINRYNKEVQRKDNKSNTAEETRAAEARAAAAARAEAAARAAEAEAGAQAGAQLGLQTAAEATAASRAAALQRQQPGQRSVRSIWRLRRQGRWLRRL